MFDFCDDCKGRCETCRFMRSMTTWLDVGKAFFALRQRLREYNQGGNFTDAQKDEVCTMLDGLKNQVKTTFDGEG